MYLRAVHAEFDIPSLRAFVRDNLLGILITALPSSNFPTIQCTHIPWILDIMDERSATELGVLRGHLAKANPHSKALIEAMQAIAPPNGSLEQEVTVLFNGPVHSYVTPHFYTDTKPATGKVVPTWDYSAVQAYGKAKIYFDSKSAETSDFLQKQIHDLTNHAEKFVMKHTGGENATAWQVDDAPVSYIDLLKKSIIGIEIKVERLEGKWKMSQELGDGDRRGVVDGFGSLGTDAGSKMARTVDERGALKDAKKAS